jgi:LEA14-like dessication related protein
MKKFLLRNVLVLSLFGASSCVADLDRVQVNDYRLDQVTFAGASKIKITVSIKVYNPTAKILTLKSAAFDVLDGDVAIARIHLTESVDVPASSDGYHTLPLELSITNMLALFASSIDLHNPQLEKLLVSGSLKVKAGLLNKTVTIREKTIGQLLKSL